MEKATHDERRVTQGLAGSAIAISGLEKSFGGAKALDGVSLTVQSGEIHGLLGQNGSGKSTLIKILAGFHAPDPGGRLSIRGEEVILPLPPGRFHSLGMRFVHQDLGLIPSLTVLENLLIEQLSTDREWTISWRRANGRARELFERFGLELDPTQPVSSLRPVHRALLAIVRAVSSMPDSTDAARGLLVLDEPTVYLPKDDTELLFDLTRRVAKSGAGVLFVSHDIDEVMQLTDRVTVLRDGRVVGTAHTAESSAEDIVELIVGRKILPAARISTSTVDDGRHKFRIEGLAGGAVEAATFDIAQGEILGVTGLSGSGFEDLPYLLFGVAKANSGVLHLGNSTLGLDDLNPAAAFTAGLALVPADRQRDGAILSLSVMDNVSMQILNQFQRGPFLNRRRLRDEARRVLGRFDVRPADPNVTCSSLSGGNQQKVLMAKWLQTRPSLLLIHEPTQGVDIGAREEIFAVLRSAAAEGTTILCATSDHEQLALLCDRVLVFSRGQVSAELTGQHLTKEAISELCYSAPSALDRSA